MHTLKIVAMTLSGALLLNACSSVKLDQNAPPVEERTATSPAAGSDPRAVSTVTAGSRDPLNDPQGILATRSIYFDLDSYTVRDEFRPVLEAHARHLSADKRRKIIIQGNTDERGGREYNLALGQKRAEAVRRALSLLGVADNQMEAISFGEEKPKATGTEESALAENRRADIVY